MTRAREDKGVGSLYDIQPHNINECSWMRGSPQYYPLIYVPFFKTNGFNRLWSAGGSNLVIYSFR